MDLNLLALICSLILPIPFADGVPSLILLSNTSVGILDLHTGDVLNTVYTIDRYLTHIAVDTDRRSLFLGNKGTIVYKTVLSNQTVNDDFQPLIDTGLHEVTGIVIEHMTSNVYMADQSAGSIIVCTSKGDNCTILLDKLEQPTSVAIQSNERTLLWTEMRMNSLYGTIMRSDLDGDNVKMVLDYLNEPRDLVIDSSRDVMYWSEKHDSQYVIMSAKLDGEDKKEIIKPEEYKPSMCVFQNSLYIANGKQIIMVDVTSGHIIKNHTVEFENISSLYIDSHEPLDPNVAEYSCTWASCSEICVISSNHVGYKCKCRLDEVLGEDGSCSRDKNKESVLVSGLSGIYDVSVRYIGYHGYRKRNILNDDISCLVYDATQGRIFYFADSRRAIFKTYNNALQNSLSVYSDVFRLEDMTFDEHSEVLYWTTALGDVHVGAIDSSYTTIIITDLLKPRGIALDTETGFLYICDWGEVPRILQCHMDGSNCITFIHINGGHPNMVVLATAFAMEYGSRDLRKTLYWTDSKLDMIGYIHLDGAGVSKGEFLLKHDSNVHPYSLAVLDDRIYFTDWNTRQLHYIQGTNTSFVVDIELDAGTLYSIVTTKPLNNVHTTACSRSNGGCSHLCLSKPNKQRTCLCPDHIDNVTCSGVSKTSSVQPVSHLSAVVSPDQTSDVSVTSSELEPVYNTSDRNSSGTPKHSLVEDRFVTDNIDTGLLALILISGLVILSIVIVIAVIFYKRRKHEKRNWMLKLIHYVKTRQHDDIEGLVCNSTSTVASVEPTFKQYDDIDYPEDKYCLRFHGNDNRREISMVSVDSAFNEMKEFDNMGSSDNLQE
ncbi:Low-density lipoprotein receptor-related protein 1B [Mactra antiquata]